MKGISSFAVKYPVSVLMITLGVCLLGVISYSKLGTDLFPDLNNPSLYIELEAGERPPEEIEKQFVTNIESQVVRQDGVKSVSSVCKVGSAQVTVTYDWDQDMDEAFLDLSRAVSQYSSNSEIESITVSRYDANAEPVIEIALTNSDIDDMNELRKIADNYLRSELVRLDGIADIQLNGQEEAFVEIKTNKYMMDAFGLTPNTIASKIESLAQNVSGGSVLYNDVQYTVKGVNLIATLEDISNIVVAFNTSETTTGGTTTTTGGSPVYLRDVAEINLVNKDPDNICRFNGERCLGISVYKENKFNTVQAVENVSEKLEEMESALPGYEFHIISNQGQFIDAAIGEVKDTAVLGVILAMAVLFVFLKRFNVTMVVCLSIPISIIATFNLMYFNGMSMNIMTLGGLALGAGMLIDNAIVVMENIFRYLEKGVSPNEASIKGASEVGGAITSSTLTTIVVFLPIVYIQGAAGELFKEQAWTVSFSLLSSLIVAMLVIPMLASKFIKADTKAKASVQIPAYSKLISWVMGRKKMVLFVAILITIVSYASVPLLTAEFMPRTESREFSIFTTLEPGTRLEATEKASASIERLLTEIAGNDIEWIYSQVGPSNTESSFGGVLETENQAQIKVKLSDTARISADMLIAFITENSEVPDGVNISYEKEQSALQSIMGTESSPVVIEVRGDELDVIEQLSKEIRVKLEGIKGVYGVQNSMEDGAPEVEIKIDRLKSGIYGIDIATVAQQVEQELNGTEAGTFDYEGEQIDLTIKVPETRLDELKNVIITQGSTEYRLAEIAEITIATAPKEISRHDQIRTGKITALLESGYNLGSVTPAINEMLSQVEFPAHYYAKLTGEEEQRAESFDGLSFALFLSVLLVYMVMAAQFESLKHPFTIIFSIPFAGVGCILALLFTGTSLNMMAFIGIIMLAGIAVNNAILLVDATNRYKEEGMGLEQAIISAAQQRVRPILMTSLTTILAMLPMSMGIGEGAALRAPMAIVVIGGLATSTLMTLIVIPCVYYYFDRKKQ
ncbi:MAG: efflux RND transporter permease subunit [Bacteroidales bacterium]|nr:efflux RND transporter permease subunit [Bacteroidales bacterium]